MIISITGTPGTGKSAVAAVLARQMNANLVSIGILVAKKHCRLDKQRKTKIVDINKLQKWVNKKIIKGRPNIVEGHLSHKLRSDIIIVLRTRPDILKKRLKKKQWPEKKIKENVQAEILGIISAEAMQFHKKRIYELDTTKLKPKTAAGTITKLLNNHLTRRYEKGSIDWSEKYKKELMVL